MRYNKCEHKRIKKNFPFGRKSSPIKYCKDCGEVVTNINKIKNRNVKR